MTKTNLTTVKVEWFDKLKGIGEGLTSDNKKVFLNSTRIKEKGVFIAFDDGQELSCELNINDKKCYYATKIYLRNK